MIIYFFYSSQKNADLTQLKYYENIYIIYLFLQAFKCVRKVYWKERYINSGISPLCILDNNSFRVLLKK